jgi:hypothetical protein
MIGVGGFPNYGIARKLLIPAFGEVDPSTDSVNLVLRVKSVMPIS